MIDLSSLKNNTYYVVGLARSGLATVAALEKSGVRVYAFDDKSGGTPPDEIDWRSIDALVLSPGIPHTYPKPHRSAELALKHDVPIICDIDLLAQVCPNATYVGVTGTNGKSTTVSLLKHLLPDAQLGGNIGVPVLELESFDNKEGIYLLELSSYQLERVPNLACDVAVWLNITEDHIDRHRDFEGYLEAKKNIFTPSEVPQSVVICIDEFDSYGVWGSLAWDDAKNIIGVSSFFPENVDLSIVDEALYDDDQKVLDFKDLKNLPGIHNHRNIAAAYGVFKALNIPFDVEKVATFVGLPHRQEYLGDFDGVTFVNDSKSTNGVSTLTALVCYEKIHLVLGGIAKKDGLSAIGGEVKKIKHAYVFGEAAERFSKELSEYDISHSCFETLEEATGAAHKKARRGTVLLSPACASFDQYKNFEERGEDFKRIVRELTRPIKETSRG